MNFPYINFISQVEKELKNSKRKIAKEKTIKHLKKEFGVSWDEVDIPGDRIEFCLARQVATSNVETVLVYELTKVYGAKFAHFSFEEDHYVSANPYKVSLVKVRTRENGQTKIKRIAFPEEKEPLGKIKTITGEFLPEYHNRNFKILEAENRDFSSLFAKVLAESLKHGYIHKKTWIIEKDANEKYKANKYYWDGKDYVSGVKKLSKREVVELAERKLARPDASWYYKNIYFFIPGILWNLILCVTPWEEDDEKIQEFVAKSYKHVKEVSGVYPLITPFFNIGNYKKARTKLGKHPEYVILKEIPEISVESQKNIYEASKIIGYELIKYV